MLVSFGPLHCPSEWWIQSVSVGISFGGKSCLRCKKTGLAKPRQPGAPDAQNRGEDALRNTSQKQTTPWWRKSKLHCPNFNHKNKIMLVSGIFGTCPCAWSTLVVIVRLVQDVCQAANPTAPVVRQLGQQQQGRNDASAERSVRCAQQLPGPVHARAKQPKRRGAQVHILPARRQPRAQNQGQNSAAQLETGQSGGRGAGRVQRSGPCPTQSAHSATLQGFGPQVLQGWNITFVNYYSFLIFSGFKEQILYALVSYKYFNC